MALPQPMKASPVHRPDCLFLGAQCGRGLILKLPRPRYLNEQRISLDGLIPTRTVWARPVSGGRNSSAREETGSTRPVQRPAPRPILNSSAVNVLPTVGRRCWRSRSATEF